MHHINTFRRNALAGALAIALLAPLGAFAQTASSAAGAQSTEPQTTSSSDQSSSTANQKKAVKLKGVIVTGSLIPRVEIEGPAPVTVITAAQIKQEGFNTVYEMVNSLTQSLPSQSPPSWGSTSVNARQANLLGLGSGRTLVLVDGHRIDNYPQPANGSTNFQNLNNIPTGLIDRVEILATGASSIYGSDAIAGVINIILKKSYQGDDLQVQAGGATRGGRRYGDINLVGGRSGDHWHIVYNLEHTNRSPLWGSDRPYTDSEADAGYGTWGPSARMFGYQTYDGLSLYNASGNYIAPPAGSCGQFPHFALRDDKTIASSGTTVTGPVTDHGSYCTQPNLFRNWVLTPGIRSTSAYVYGEYDFDNDLQVYASAQLYDTVGTTNTELPFLYPMGGLPNGFYDQTTGQVITNYFRQFTSAEMGSSGNTHDREQNWLIQGGLRGTMFSDRFNWDLHLGTSKYIVHEDYAGLNEQGYFDYFFGPQLGTTSIGGTSYPVYALDSNRYWNPITPSQYATFGVKGQNSSWTWMDQASFNVNGDLFNTWSGKPIGFAAVLQANHQGYTLDPDPRGNTTSFGDPFQDYNTGSGTRGRFSLGTEFRIPLLDTLTMSLAGRIDKYNDASKADIARTWSGALEWRPYDGLLLRGTYGTNFLAPDMQYVYKTASASTVGIYSDPLQCIQANAATCDATQHSTYFTLNTGGSRNLLNQTGHSWTYGFVWQIPGVEGLTLSSDYWHTGLDNAIDNIGLSTVLTDEAGCLTGKQVGGAPYVAHAVGSEYCHLVIDDVQRDAAGNITYVNVGPINEAEEYRSGTHTDLTYNLSTTNWGLFRFDLDWTDYLVFHDRTLPTDPLINSRAQNLHSKMRGTGAWTKGPWDVTLYWQRAGEVHANNYGGCEVLSNGTFPSSGDPQCVIYDANIHPWIIWSTSVGYRFTDRLRVNMFVSNIFNNVGEIPYYAGGFEFIPTVQGADYNGREISLQLNYKLD